MSDQVSLSAFSPTLASVVLSCSVGQEIPAFVSKHSVESQSFDLSWLCKIELGGYIMVLSCSLGLPN